MTEPNKILTFDGLQNLVTSMGTSGDKAQHAHFIWQYISYIELGMAYRESWLARALVNVPIQDAMREWRKWDEVHEKEIAREEKRLRLRYNLTEALKWARLYGGAAIVMFIKNHPLDEPLELETVKKGELERLLVVDRWELSPQRMSENMEDRLSEYYYTPPVFTVRGGNQQIHHTHLIKCHGAVMPPQIQRYEMGWGDSEMRKCFQDLKDVISMKRNIATMVQEANVDIIRRQGLADALSTGQEEAIRKRYQSFNMMKGAQNLGLLDMSEEYERKNISFAGLAQVIDLMYTWIAGATGIPVTRLFGTSPSGESATGEGDQKTYYDDIRAKQENEYRYYLEPLDEVMLRSLYGEVPEDAKYAWRPLFMQSGLELETSMLSKAQRDAILLEQGVINEFQSASSWRQEGLYPIDKDWLDRLESACDKIDVEAEVTANEAEQAMEMEQMKMAQPNAASQRANEKPGVSSENQKSKGNTGAAAKKPKGAGSKNK